MTMPTPLPDRLGAVQDGLPLALRDAGGLATPDGLLDGARINDLLRSIGDALDLDATQGLALPGGFLLATGGEPDSGDQRHDEQQRQDPAQPRTVAGFAHVDAIICAIKPCEITIGRA